MLMLSTTFICPPPQKKKHFRFQLLSSFQCQVPVQFQLLSSFLSQVPVQFNLPFQFFLKRTTTSLLVHLPSAQMSKCSCLFFIIKNSLELTYTKGHITFNESIPYWGLQGQALNDLCKWLYAFWISKTALSWLIQKVILLSMKLSHNEGSVA